MACVAITAFWIFGAKAQNADTSYVYVDADDNLDSVMTKVEAAAQPTTMYGFQLFASWKDYGSHVRTGRYRVDPGMTMLQLFRNLRNHDEEPIRLVVPATRLLTDLAGRLDGKLMVDSAALVRVFADESLQAELGVQPETFPALFIPNTYEVYWDMSAVDFVKRMKREYDAFWTEERLAKADALGLTPIEVSTLASIVDSESAYNPEKPRIAGLYLNRLRKGMLLQSDPTVIYAVGDFTIRRVLNEHLSTDSPYNTYLYQGLPPGPIRLPSVVALDAVLNAEQHDYLYMCAKEDFSGSHNFAVSYGEHLQNARRYINELNRRGIQR